MDDYPPYSETFYVNPSADVQFDNIQYMYIGKNESMLEGFVGCISRVEFDDLYPLKLMFQENRPSNVWGNTGEPGREGAGGCGWRETVVRASLFETLCLFEFVCVGFEGLCVLRIWVVLQLLQHS